ncbi:MAG: LysM peptidoglycan-binding domain-containing protein, partial [Chloroflexota bacterium]
MDSSEKNTSTFQRIAIGVGTLIVVILTVVAAVFLALQDVESPSPTTEAVTPTVVVIIPTATPFNATANPLPATATLAPVEPTQTPVAVATNTPAPLPTSTTAPVIEETATPLPAPTNTPQPAVSGCPQPEGWVVYTIVEGDTLNSLSERADQSVFDLERANCLGASNNLEAGQSFYLPFIPPTVTPTNTPLPPTATLTPSITPSVTRTPTAEPTPRAPIISNISPSQGLATEEIRLSVTGDYFNPIAGFRVELINRDTADIFPMGQLGLQTPTGF